MKKTILLIEDDTFLANMYAAKLKMENFNILMAEDGEKGLSLALSSQPDLILLDLILPGIDGFEILKKLKTDPEMKRVPIIILTNLGKREEVDKGLALGADDYLIKAHFMPTEVIAKIKNFLDKE